MLGGCSAVDINKSEKATSSEEILWVHPIIENHKWELVLHILSLIANIHLFPSSPAASGSRAALCELSSTTDDDSSVGDTDHAMRQQSRPTSASGPSEYLSTVSLWMAYCPHVNHRSVVWCGCAVVRVSLALNEKLSGSWPNHKHFLCSQLVLFLKKITQALDILSCFDI